MKFWLALVLCFALLPPPVMSMPAGGKVTAGTAVITHPNGQTLNINQLTDKAIINWKGFSINVNELVKFVQPNSNSVVLNRVIGVDPSSILGKLIANGRVFIVNPNGVLFGPHSTVDVAALLATTLNINDSDFLAGKYNFSQDPNKALSYVINKGEIKIADNGFVFLVAPGVVNEGLIIANLGKAVMASGQKLALDFTGDGLISFAIEGKVLDRVLGPDGTPLTSAVNNSGTIRADGGQVVLTAKASSEIFSSVVNNSGVIEARSLVNRGGVIRLEGSDPVANTGEIGWQNNLGKVHNAEGAVINTGRLDVSAAERGAAPGQITLSGQMVGSSGAISARGAEGSQGGGVLITSTDKTVLTSDSQIDASGVSNSSAGNIVVWSDKDTVFRGTIIAKGGEAGGNGGQIEVSGHENLGFTGQVNAVAPNGSIGSVLLDPRNITVANGGSAALGQVDQFSDTPGTDQTIAPATINAAAANVVLQANNDITVNNAISMTNVGVGITMQAGRDINVNANVATNNGNITMTANDSGATAANRADNTPGDITMAAGTSLNSGTGNISLNIGASAAAPFAPGNITTGALSRTGAGSITLSSRNGVTLNDVVNAGAGTVTVTANADGAGADAFTMAGAGAITTTNTSASAVQINVNAAGGGTGGVNLQNITTGATGTITVATNTGGNTTGGAISQGAGTALNVGTGNFSTGNGTITLNSGTNNFGTVAIGRATDVILTDANALTLGASTISGTLSVNTVGALTQSGAVSVTGNTSLAAGPGNDITLNNASNNFSTVGIASGNNVTLRDTNALTLGTSTVTGALNVTAGAAITQTGPLVGTTLTAKTLNNGGAAITLNDPSNNFSAVNLSARNAADTANAAGAITYQGAGGFDVSGLGTTSNATLTANGNITDSGTIVVTGTTTLAAGTGNDITLDNANNFSTVSITSGRNVTLNDTNALILGASTVSGTLGVTTAGAITQSGALNVTGTTSLAAGATNDITLNNALNNFSTVGITSGRNVTLVDSNALDLATSTVSGTLNVTTAGAITDSGNLNVTGATTLAAGAGNDITLDSAGNNFSTVAITSGRNVALTDSNALDLGTSTVSGTLNVTTSGAITDSGNVVVSGATTLASGSANDITLNSAGNNFSTLGITSGRNVTLVDSNVLDLGASSVSGNLALTTGGAVTQSGALNVAGTTSLTASAANTDIALNTQANNFAGALSFGGTLTNFRDIGLRNTNATATVPTLSGLTNLRNLTLTFDSAPVNLPALTVSGTLNVTAGGTITDSGNVVVTGTTTLAAGPANDITLDSAGNNFSTVAINSGNNVTLRDVNGLDLGTSNVTGNLNITTGGTITDSGNIVVAGVTTLAAGSGNDVILDSAGNNFSTVGVTSARNVTLADVNTLDLGTSTVSGTLNVTTSGALTQSGSLNVTGATTLSAGTANDITLNNGSNNFSTVAINSGNNVTLADTNALDLGASTVSGTLTVTTNGSLTQSGALTVAGATTLADGASNDITLTNAANDFSTVAVTSGRNVALTDANALDLGASTISGSLNVTTNGAITDSGNVMVGGATTLAAGSANNITLDSPGNNFSTVAVNSGNNVVLTDVTALDLGTSTIAGTLNVVANGLISQSGALTVGGNASFDTTAATALGSVSLANGGALTMGTSTIGGTLALNTTAGDLILAPGQTLTVAGDANLIAGGSVNLLGSTQIGGTQAFNGATGSTFVLASDTNLNALPLPASGNITVNLTGTQATFAGAPILASAVNLSNPGNNFGGTVSVTTASPAFIGSVTDTHNLAQTSSVSLNPGQALTVTDLGGTAGKRGNITLDNPGNNLNSVNFTGGDIAWQQANAISIGSASANLGITSSGALTITANGPITQTGPVTAAGITTLNATGGNITLTNGANDFNTVSVPSGNDVTLVDANALNLAASTVTGNLIVTTNGPLTQSGPLTVAGTTTLAAGSANNITLNSASNDFAIVAVTSGNNVTLVDNNALSLGTSAISGTLNIITNGSLTQSGPVAVTGTTTLATGSSNDITLNNAGNNFGTVAVASARNVALRDADTLDLGASTISGTLAVSTGGAVTQSGSLNITGNATFAAGTSNDITLSNAANDFSTVAITSGRNVTVQDANVLNLGASTVSGTLNVTTNGDLTQSGTLTVTGATTLAAGSGSDITLDNAGNDFSTVTVAGGNNVSLRDANSISLGTSTVSGNFRLTAGGAIVDGDGPGINITANSTSLTAATNVGLAANPLETAVDTLNATSNAGGVYITETDGLTVNSVVANGGNVAISNSTGDMVINAISAAGSIDLLAAGGSIFDGNGAANNLTAVADSNLRALGGVIGLSTDPIEVNINPGLLGVAATGQIGGVSVHINGTVSPTNTLTLLNSPPGEVIFNSQSANPSPINLPNLIGIAAELNSYRVNENDYFTDLLLDVLSEDFFKAQPFYCKLDDSLKVDPDSNLCTDKDR